MKKLPLLAAGLGLLALLAPTSALAQKAEGPKAKFFAKYDTNKNGVIDGDEIIALRKDFDADPKGELRRFDTNHDGKLSDEEIAAIKPPGSGGKKGDKKAKAPDAAPADSTPATDKPAADKPADAKPADPKPADAPKDSTKP
jgi:hypothetical protein